MDVQDLAPALLALADLVQIANKKFNGDRAEIRVLVNADVEQRCFMVDLSLSMSLLDQAKTFFDSDRIKTAKEIAEWIGIVKGGAGGAVGGLFALLAFLKGKKKESPLQITQTGSQVTIVGDGNTIVIASETYELAQDRVVVDRVRSIMQPLTKPGYDDLSFLEGKDEVVRVSSEQAENIFSSASEELIPFQTESTSQIRGLVRIKSPQYEGGAKWSLLWNGRAVDAEMAENAAAWVAAFQQNRVNAPPNTVLEVSMTETVRLDENGLALGRPRYVVSDVHSVTPPPSQIGLI